MGMGRVMSMRNYFAFEPTVERVNGLFELFDCVGTFLNCLKQEKFKVAGGYVYDDLADDWAEAGACVDDLGELALGGLICTKLGFIERIYPQVPGIDPEETGIYTVTPRGLDWLEHYRATYAARHAAWEAEQDELVARAEVERAERDAGEGDR